jgi:hypothetical protein
VYQKEEKGGEGKKEEKQMKNKDEESSWES